MKNCQRCLKDKPELKFGFRNKSKNILHSYCRDCKREIDRLAYQTNPARKAKMRKTAWDLIKRNRRFVKLLKIIGVCSKCGDKRWYVLDLHHLGDKKIEISDMISRGTSIENLKKEIKKCVLLCSNCHREEHYLIKKGDKANLVEASD